VRIEGTYRQLQCDRVRDALDDTGGALVIGPAGCGRSVLLEAVGVVEAQTRRVWWCRGHRVGAATAAPELAGSVGSRLDDVAAHPTTVLVDDAHLLDAALLGELALLAERRRALGLRLVVARRPVRARDALARLDAALLDGRGAIHLGPLTPAATAAWLADAATDDAATRSAVAASGGWPELVALAVADPAAIADLARARGALLDAGQLRVVRALSFGLPVGSDALVAATGATAEDIDLALDAAVLVGLVHEGDTPVPALAAAIRADTPAADRERIATAALGAPADVLVTAARCLAELGDRSGAAGAAFEAAAVALGADSPADVVALCDAAVRAGRPAAPFAARRAAAALAARRPDLAVTLVDDGAVAGAAWAHLAEPDLAAACYLRADDDRLLAVLPLLAAGRVDEARLLLSEVGAAAAADGARSRPPAARLLVDGVAAWVDGRPADAAELFERSARLAALDGGVVHWPDSPAALLTAATPLLDGDRATAPAALDVATGGPFAERERILAAWVALRSGRIDEARAELGAVTPAPAMTRDIAIAAAVAASIALRSAEPGALTGAHRAARTARRALDLFTVDLAGELAQLAARVGDDPEVLLGPPERAATALGDPPTIAAPVAWARLMIAVGADDAVGAQAAATQLAEVATGAPAASDLHLRADAARAFAEVLDGRVDSGEIRSLGDRLAAAGLVFEAVRLIGVAALRSSDPAGVRALLADLRRLRSTQVRTAGDRPRPVAELSEREREVARAVLAGRTHREIGAELYISAKTVEHHVARIRQKLGATTKAELLAAIREEMVADGS
jgi:DNA-binding CsgD family transcriptional regulator